MPRFELSVSRYWWMLLALVGFVILACSAITASAQDEDDETLDPWLPGLLAKYSVDAKSAVRVESNLSLVWPEKRVDARLPAADFTAIYSGHLLAQGNGNYQFEAYVRGDVKIIVAGKTVLEGSSPKPAWIAGQPIELSFDHHPITIEYRSSGENPELRLFWRGPQFALEPIPPRFLFHDRTQHPPLELKRGESLAHALRCSACHRDEQATADASIPAPSLKEQQAWLQADWIVQHLLHKPARDSQLESRRMPQFAISEKEANLLARWLTNVESSDEKAEVETPPPSNPQPSTTKETPAKPRPSKEQGELLIASLGCLACHHRGELGQAGIWGGTSLDDVAKKRPANFVAIWLSDPSKVNRNHRMPVFDLSSDEISSISKALSKSPVAEPKSLPLDDKQKAEAIALATKYRCHLCHELPSTPAPFDAQAVKPLSKTTDWKRSCASLPNSSGDKPAYGLAREDAEAIAAWYSSRDPSFAMSITTGELLLQRSNCLACHQREGIDRSSWQLTPSLAEKLPAITETYAQLPAIPILTPPALNSVGDKFHEQALTAVIRRQERPHRPYLAVRMPRFPLAASELTHLTTHLISADRIPDRASEYLIEQHSPSTVKVAGSRLVTTDGFGCTSCHQVGSVLPANAPANARGPSLSMLDSRIRRAWFDRWVRNPQRIVPRMEMPSVQLAVKGVLNDHLPSQLDAVWKALNQEGFEPPLPNPVRTLRLSGTTTEKPLVLTDVIELDKSFGRDKPLVRPFAVGFSNRHNLVFDLAAGSLLDWRSGDLARQRTRGKTWYWELAGASLVKPRLSGSEFALLIDGKKLLPSQQSDGVMRLESWEMRDEGTLSLSTTLLWEPDPLEGSPKDLRNFVPLAQYFEPRPALQGRTGIRRTLHAVGIPDRAELVMQLIDPAIAAKAKFGPDHGRLALPESECYLEIVQQREGRSRAEYRADGALVVKPVDGIVDVTIDYVTTTAIDLYPGAGSESFPIEAAQVEVATGLQAERLPLWGDIMPTAIAYDEAGRMYFASLKGQVFAAVDNDGNGSEDTLELLADGLPAPYGIAVEPSRVLVLAKYGLVALHHRVSRERLSKFSIAASGWGYTADYHDWAVGLPSNGRGGYLVAIPCQQDKRSASEARLRGKFLELLPRDPTEDDPSRFAIRVMSAGHRFPMGLARSSQGEIFVTDNQGNYNPFNELNHVEQGSHFGFVNSIEKEAKTPVPPLKAPAIDIPHPWTRSVNGITFLETPAKLKAEKGSLFGPWEGHLVGCEYDTRRLIRMSLEKIDGVFQGAAYPLSGVAGENGLLGPVVATISPAGELVVGNLRDSGWGAGNNIGDITKIKIDPSQLPAGVAEVTIDSQGFRIAFTKPVDAAKATDVKSYTISHYRRVSTPAYGGADVDRRDVTPLSATLSDDRRSVLLQLSKLETGVVYEIQLKNLTTSGKDEFFPAEAHYTVRKLPPK